MISEPSKYKRRVQKSYLEPPEMPQKKVKHAVAELGQKKGLVNYGNPLV